MKIKKVIASALIVASALALNPVGASATWKKNAVGWWNTEGSTWSVGWRLIDSRWYYFDNTGYMKTGWVQDGASWYYLNTNGDMASNITIGGYTIGSNGAWIDNKVVSNETASVTKAVEPVVVKTETAKASSSSSSSSNSSSSSGSSHPSSNHSIDNNTPSAQDIYNAESATYISVFYYLADNEIRDLCDGRQSLDFYDGVASEYITKTYGMLLIKKSDYNIITKSEVHEFLSRIRKEYEIITQDGKATLVKKSENVNNNRVRIPTQSELNNPANIMSVFYRLDDLSITMVLKGKHTLESYYGDDLSKKSKVEATYGVIIVDSVAYPKYDYLNTANVMYDSSLNEEYKIVNDNGVAKLVSRTIEETESYDRKGKGYLTILYYLKDGDIFEAGSGIQDLRGHNGGSDEEREYNLQNYGILVIKESDYNFTQEDILLEIMDDYEVVGEDRQAKLVKKSENANNTLPSIPVETTTSSAVTIQ